MDLELLGVLGHVVLLVGHLDPGQRSTRVTEGSWETLKGCELVGIDPVSWVDARSARRSVRGGQNLSARRVGNSKI